jgi:hypothetical protein
MAAETPKYRYRVDAADVILSANPFWFAFAQENGAAELTERSVLGQSLWNFVEGEAVRRLYREIHARVRVSGRRVVLPFRCDSPLLRRHMRLTITREDEGALLYECILVRAEPQRRLAVLDAEQPRSDAFLTICSCCKRALLEPVGWLDVEDIAARLKLFETQRVPRLHHVICPSCTHALREASDNGNAA